MSLSLAGLAVRFRGGPPLFPPLDLEIAPGQMAAVMGPSGVGKSTLLDAVGGHLAHGFSCEGRVTLNGRDVTGLPPEARRIGLVFQDAGLFPHLSVGDNLAFGLARSVRGRAARRAAVERALAQAGLEGMAARDPATLSGGQRARAALMRALLAGPEAILLDEPFSGLDTERRSEMRAFTLDLIRRRAIPALIVTHDPADAEAAGGPRMTLSAA
ncbi:ATP-binding cassette domain-containing protein [Rhodovulum sp. 12E13]|uniref:ATP-binding cassette domain-containing protein n=1 Tax=Rhodovulum sp. 12E13 TaxID=2203891 RepID=UPI000E173B27|nr:ATP-binding cassette domain-containing protein [Rhodovulum sp. 12E13]RDC73632.1 ATP-binding cassette domain-containing protein [Rhodovulum sp. 12E13]